MNQFMCQKNVEKGQFFLTVGGAIQNYTLNGSNSLSLHTSSSASTRWAWFPYIYWISSFKRCTHFVLSGPHNPLLLPLDVGVFKSFKSFLNKSCSEVPWQGSYYLASLVAKACLKSFTHGVDSRNPAYFLLIQVQYQTAFETSACTIWCRAKNYKSTLFLTRDGGVV